MAMELKNTKDIGKDPKIREPWPDNYIDWNNPWDKKLLDEFEKTLAEAKDEKPLHAFFKQHSYLLAIGFYPHCCWVFEKPRLGGGLHIPDFLYCDKNSLGFRYILVELENPTLKATNKDQSVSHATNHAVQQIRDYRDWLRKNALAEQKNFQEITEQCEAWIVIGRSDSERDEVGSRRLADFRREHIEIASYDRLLAEMKNHLDYIHGKVESSKKAIAEWQEKKAVPDKTIPS